MKFSCFACRQDMTLVLQVNFGMQIYESSYSKGDDRK